MRAGHRRHYSRVGAGSTELAAAVVKVSELQESLGERNAQLEASKAERQRLRARH